MLKPQSYRIVRLLDRTIGCDLANVRPIGNVCYDLQKRPLTIWNNRFQVLNMTMDLVATDCPMRSPTTSAISRTTYPARRTLYFRFAHDCNIFRSQVGRNLVVSPVWLDFEHEHDLAATDLSLAITHDLCDQSYDLCEQSYDLCEQSYDLCDQSYSYDWPIIFRSQVGRNLVVSLVWLGL